MRRRAGMWASVTGTMVAEGCGEGVVGGRAVTGKAGITGATGCGAGGGGGGTAEGDCCGGGCCCWACDVGGAAYFGGCCLLFGWKKERIEGCCARDMAG